VTPDRARQPALAARERNASEGIRARDEDEPGWAGVLEVVGVELVGPNISIPVRLVAGDGCRQRDP